MIIDVLCGVLESTECNTQIHGAIVLINSLINNKNRLLERIISKRKTICKLVTHFNNMVGELDTLNEKSSQNSQTKNF